MRTYAVVILGFVILASGYLFYAGRVHSGPPQSHSLDTPEGQAIHRAMMMQMQQMQARDSQDRSQSK